MPSKSEAQRRLMAAAAHDPAFAKRVGVPQTVAREFNKADSKAKKKSGNGEIIGRLSTGKPVVRNADGSVSTHRMATVGVDNGAANIPTMIKGRQVSVKEAFEAVKAAGFKDPDTGERIRTYRNEAAARTDYELRQHRQVDREASWILRQHDMGKKKK